MTKFAQCATMWTAAILVEFACELFKRVKNSLFSLALQVIALQFGTRAASGSGSAKGNHRLARSAALECNSLALLAKPLVALQLRLRSEQRCRCLRRWS